MYLEPEKPLCLQEVCVVRYSVHVLTTVQQWHVPGTIKTSVPSRKVCCQI